MADVVSQNASCADFELGRLLYVIYSRLKYVESKYRFIIDISLLKEATIEELTQLLPKDVAEELFNKLH